MAERAKAKPKSAKGKVKGKPIATLPKGKKGKRGIGDNSGMHAVPDEVIARHLAILKSKKKALDKVVADYKEDLDQARGVYRSARKLAKKEGVNLKAFDITASLEAEDMGHVQVNYADAGRYLRLTDSPLAEQLSLFQNMEAPAPAVDVALQGQKAGENAEPIENCPYPAGSDEGAIWLENWHLGQKRNMDAMKH